MIINLKNNKNLSTNDLRNSYQVQWWYIHEFYTDSLSFAVLSLVNSSLEQTHRGNIAYYLDNQYHTLKNVPSESEFLFGKDLPKKNKNSQSCLVCHKAITCLKWAVINLALIHTHPHLLTPTQTHLHPPTPSIKNVTLTHTHPHLAKKRSHSPTPTHIQPKTGHTHPYPLTPRQKKVTLTHAQPKKVTLPHTHPNPAKKCHNHPHPSTYRQKRTHPPKPNQKTSHPPTPSQEKDIPTQI